MSIQDYFYFRLLPIKKGQPEIRVKIVRSHYGGDLYRAYDAQKRLHPGYNVFVLNPTNEENNGHL